MTEPASDHASAAMLEDARAVADLSDRQYACLVRAGEGLSSKEIGRLLGISPSTVDNHIHAAMTKLHARNRWQAAQLLHPKSTKDESRVPLKQTLLPPVGGRSNNLPIRQRLIQVLAIAAMSLIALTAAYVVVLGAIAVFGFD